jgi:tRNA-splicing ligase RtcB
LHRKGATRAFGPASPEIPAAYREVGQPVFVPGSMGTASFMIVGLDASADVSFGSACHGAGRALSRTAAKRHVAGHVLRRELEASGIVVRCSSNQELAEEAPLAYKDVERVVDVVARAASPRRWLALRAPRGPQSVTILRYRNEVFEVAIAIRSLRRKPFGWLSVACADS